MSTFVYRYGTHEHAVGEIVDMQWSETAHHTRRGWRDTSMTRVVLTGQLLGCDYGEVATEISKLAAAYEYNQLYFGLHDPAGNPTKYVLDPTDPRLLVGPRVHIKFPTGSLEEMVVKREYQIILEAIWASQESEIIDYDEQITHYGTTGPEFTMQKTVNQGVFEYQTWPGGTERVIQQGHSVGFSGYYLAGATPHPLLPAQYEHVEQRVEMLGKPLHLGRGWVYFPASWRYVFELPNYTLVTPV